MPNNTNSLPASDTSIGDIKCWPLYYSKEEYTVFNKEVPIVLDVIKEFHSKESGFFSTIIANKKFHCDYEIFEKFKSFNAISCGLSEVIYQRFDKRLITIETLIKSSKKSVFIENITPALIDSLISVTGTVSSVGCKKIENLFLSFECIKCSSIVRLTITSNLYKSPSMCVKCKNKTFRILPNHPDNVCIDTQEIKLQGIQGAERPKSIACTIYGDFVGEVAPGDVIEVLGEVKAVQVDDSHILSIKVNNLHTLRNNIYTSTNSELSTSLIQAFQKISKTGEIPEIKEKNENDYIEISTQSSTINTPLNSPPPHNDIFSIRDFHLSKNLTNLLNLFTDVFYKTIVGHSEIKNGLILSLLGGTNKFCNSAEIRPEIHVQIVGDPGLGKSRLLSETVKILPKSTYVSGNLTSTTGLTVSITHDASSGDFMADAGALVISNGSVCCIDEFDKISDHSALLEAMEDSFVTIAKAGVIASIPTRCTVVAASNPKNGHFRGNKSLRENLSFNSALLSRFDLIYILQDNFSTKENYEIGKKILIESCKNNSKEDKNVEEGGEILSKKELLKLYIEYAKNSVKPLLSTAAEAKIKNYFVKLRNLYKCGCTLRHLETLIRMTEALAKLELKSIASEEHAVYAIHLYAKQEEVISSSLTSTGNKTSKGEASAKVQIISFLKKYKNSQGPEINYSTLESLILKSPSEKVNKMNPRNLIEILNYEGILIKKGKDKYYIN